MKFKKITDIQLENKGILGLPDTPQFTSGEMKRKFDELPREVIIPAFNELSTELDAAEIYSRVKSGDIKAMRINLDSQLEVSKDGISFEATGSSGHLIMDKIGTMLPQRGRLQFSGEVSVADSAANNATVITGLKGDKGDKGEQGIQGIQGVQGMVGKVYMPILNDIGDISWQLVNDSGTIPAGRNIRGPQGIDGKQGIQGVQGVPGITGATGVQGIKGDKGDMGAQGVQGLTGSKGEMGAQGIKGDTGATGPQGTQGLQGVKGETGAQGNKGDTGATGTQGLQGLTGAKGETGPQGVKGDKGLQGVQGAQGIQGIAGAKGDTGAQGPQGPQGNVGAAGTDGRNFTVHGRFDSLADLQSDHPIGKDGDAWTVGTIANNTVYVWDIRTKTSTGASIIPHWEDVGPIVGPMGPQGIQGVVGPKGDTGAQGNKGDTGAQGIQGATGATGSTGSQGLTGPQGPIGAQGAQGVKGDKGDTGSQGLTGPQGPIGATGATGAKGDKGDAGAQGLTGPQGSTGVQGAKGDKGVKGDIGAQGAKGDVGPQGIQGIQGPQGERGIQGVQGVRGAQGLPTVVNGKTGENIYITASDVGALAESSTAQNSLKLGGILPTEYQKKADGALETADKTVVGAINEVSNAIPNSNLLDNTDFAHPINQRNVSGTITAAGYFIDRWKLVSGSVALTENSLQLNGTMVQILEFAIGADTTARVGVYSGTANASYNDKDKTFTLTSNGGVIGWAKLEKGSVATPYVSKGYACELSACARYYAKISSSVDNFLPIQKIDGWGWVCEAKIIMPMRIFPTVIASNIQIFTSGWSAAYTPTIDVNIWDNIVSLKININGGVVGEYGKIYIVKGIMALSADL